jgi:hypothetical protein
MGTLITPREWFVTEHDYDIFLEKNKVLSTYISNLFITKTTIFSGI